MSGQTRIFVSGCLAGETIRYNGTAATLEDAIFLGWQRQGRLVVGCPELLAGFAIPRPAAEIRGGDGETVLDGQAGVLEADGADVSDLFIAGAYLALDLALKERCAFALLKEGSPSCGARRVGDGSFSGRTVSGRGVMAALFRRRGIEVFPESEIAVLAAAVASADA